MGQQNVSIQFSVFSIQCSVKVLRARSLSLIHKLLKLKRRGKNKAQRILFNRSRACA